MKKFVSLLFILTLSSTLIGCRSNKTASINLTNNNPQWSYTAAEEEMIVITKEDLEIASIEMINIPNSGIKVAGWDDANIKLKVMYNDLNYDTFDFKEKHIPLEYRHFLGEIGHHTLSLAVNGVDVNFGFDIVKNEYFHGYTCKFIDSRTSEGEVVQEITVGYYQTAVYSGPEFTDKVIDVDTVEHFIGWDYPLTSIHQDMEFRSQFRNVEKRYYGRGLGNESDVNVVATVKEDNVWHALAYLGRVQSVAVNHNEPIYHVHTQPQDDLAFGPLNPYNEMWNELNESVYKYGVNYVINPKFNSMLYGTNGAFSNSTTFLADFEAIYGEISSSSVLLDDGSVVERSNEPNYTTSYAVASSYLTNTQEFDSNNETGYYRLAVTMAYDVYVSISFKQLAEGRYQLLQGSSFHFSAVSDSKKLVIQFSETEVFDNPFDKPLIFSNENLYHIADALDW